MSIANIIKPWSFTNNTETADAVKVNQNFDTAIVGINECINELNTAEGSRGSLTARLGVSLNNDGTIKAEALPVGTYDPRTIRVVTADDVVTENDSVLLVDTTAADVALTLPSAVTALVHPTIVNDGGTGYSVIVTPEAGESVMRQDTITLGVGGESIKLAPYGTDWRRIG